MNEEEAYEKTNETIKEVIDIFQNKIFFFLNEEDIKSYLYYRLLKKFRDDDKNKKTSSIHCNISSLDNKDNQSFVPDISICDINSFSNNDKNFYFHFDNIFTSIEIKYCIKDNKNKVIKKLWNPQANKSSEKGDYYKLCMKKEWGSNVLIFDHSSHLDLKDIILIQKNNKDYNNDIKIIYVTPKKIICVMNSEECDLFD